jgi:hypothetical protein
VVSPALSSSSAGALADLQRFGLDQPDQPGMVHRPQRGQHLGLAAQQGHSRVVQRHLEHPPLAVGGHALLHERDVLGAQARLESGQRIHDHALEPLRLSPGLQQRRDLTASAPLPAVGVARDRASVVLQLDQVQPPLAEHQRVHLVPFAVPVPELEVCPRLEWRAVGQQLTQVGQPFAFVVEL